MSVAECFPSRCALLPVHSMTTSDAACNYALTRARVSMRASNTPSLVTGTESTHRYRFGHLRECTHLMGRSDAVYSLLFVCRDDATVASVHARARRVYHASVSPTPVPNCTHVYRTCTMCRLNAELIASSSLLLV
jgi:hypothetical protein